MNSPSEKPDVQHPTADGFEPRLPERGSSEDQLAERQAPVSAAVRMTAATVRAAASSIGRPEPTSGLRWAIRDSWTEATRHLRVVPRNIELMLYATLQPVMFVLLFVYVFAGALEIPGFSDTKQFLVPGIFAQSVVFGSAFTSIGIAEDMQKGYIDRLRSLPMSRSAVLIGRTFSDLLRNVLTFVVMLLVAFGVGFRIEGSLIEAALATFLLLFFSYSLSWIQALIGLVVKSVEAANSAGFIWMFPLTFVSSAFVDPSQMPDWLQPIARNNPFTLATNAARALYNGLPAGNDAWLTVAWSFGFTILFAFLSIAKFSRSTAA
jgi:ABC-2 type transport system permease protein/oleandomycin transport system permease protein